MAKKAAASKVKLHPGTTTRTVTIMTPNGPMRVKFVFEAGTNKLRRYKVLPSSVSARPDLLSWTLSGLASKDPTKATQEARAMWRKRLAADRSSKAS